MASAHNQITLGLLLQECYSLCDIPRTSSDKRPLCLHTFTYLPGHTILQFALCQASGCGKQDVFLCLTGVKLITQSVLMPCRRSQAAARRDCPFLGCNQPGAGPGGCADAQRPAASHGAWSEQKGRQVQAGTQVPAGLGCWCK